MTAHDRIRNRTIETPVGDVTINEKKWNEGEECEHWAYVQSLNPELVDEDVATGEVLGHFLKQYAIAYELMKDGYIIHGQIDSENFLWVNYLK